MESSRPRKPGKKFPGVHVVWSGGKWKFVGRYRGGNQLVYGKVRDTPLEAFDDYRSLVENSDQRRFQAIKTLAQGIAAARQAAIERNLAATTLRSHFGATGSHASYLLTWWKETTPLKLLTPRVLSKFIRDAQAEGRNPNTLLTKDLVVLKDVFEAAGMPNPIPEAKKIAKLKRRPALKESLEFPAAMDFVRKIREQEITDSSGREKRFPRRGWHADIVALVLWTGARSSELTNLTIASARWADNPSGDQAGVLTLNGKTGERYVAIDQPLAEIVVRLIDDARKANRKILVPGGMDGLGQIIERWSKRLGMHAHARALRHTIAMGMIEAGLSLDRVRDQLGHSKITTTAEYIDQRKLVKGESIQALRKHYQPPGSSDPPQTA